jgi:archaellum component FlaF (FlaF/FlaG flagellin family)
MKLEVNIELFILCIFFILFFGFLYTSAENNNKLMNECQKDYKEYECSSILRGNYLNKR